MRPRPGYHAFLVMTIRSDVVGSLLRPPALIQARESFEAGRLAATAYKRTEDEAVDAAVRLQEAARLDVITDGEQRRYAFFGHLIESLDGFDKLGGWAIAFHNEAGEELKLRRPVVVERLRWRRSMCAEEFTYLRARSTRPLKVTLVSTQQAAAYYDPERSAGAYPTRDSYLADVVDFTRREVGELVRLGCTYVQIDAPQYAALLDPTLREGYRQRGSDPDQLIDACIEMDNAVIAGHAGVTFGLHICRGNNQSMFYASGGYEPIARVFSRARFQRFLLEYDDERSGGFEPLRAVARTGSWCSDWSRRRSRASSPWPSSARASRKPRGWFRWSGSRSVRNAGSRRRWPATAYLPTINGRSWIVSQRRPGWCGAHDALRQAITGGT